MIKSLIAYAFDNSASNTITPNDSHLHIEAYIADRERPEEMRHIDISVNIASMNVETCFNANEDETAELDVSERLQVMKIVNEKLLPFFLNELYVKGAVKATEDYTFTI